MPTVKALKLTKATHSLIRAAAILPFEDNAQPAPDGDLLVPIGDDVAERLEAKRLAGESDDDLITRLFGTLHGVN